MNTRLLKKIRQRYQYTWANDRLCVTDLKRKTVTQYGSVSAFLVAVVNDGGGPGSWQKFMIGWLQRKTQKNFYKP
jgi:hypothetical protein